MPRPLPLAVAVAVALIAPAGAAAHVGIEPTTAPAGSETTFTVLVPHGCGGSPTIAVALRVPEAVRATWPAPTPGWSLETTPRAAAGDAAEGGETALALEVVRWSGGSIPDGQLGEFRLRMALPDAPGTTLAVPAVQTCADGETRWIQVPAEGEDLADLAEPAPTLTLTAAAGSPADGADSATAEPADRAVWAALILAALALAAAIGALAIRRRP